MLRSSRRQKGRLFGNDCWGQESLPFSTISADGTVCRCRWAREREDEGSLPPPICARRRDERSLPGDPIPSMGPPPCASAPPADGGGLPPGASDGEAQPPPRGQGVASTYGVGMHAVGWSDTGASVVQHRQQATPLRCRQRGKNVLDVDDDRSIVSKVSLVLHRAEPDPRQSTYAFPRVRHAAEVYGSASVAEGAEDSCGFAVDFRTFGR